MAVNLFVQLIRCLFGTRLSAHMVQQEMLQHIQSASDVHVPTLPQRKVHVRYRTPTEDTPTFFQRLETICGTSNIPWLHHVGFAFKRSHRRLHPEVSIDVNAGS